MKAINVVFEVTTDDKFSVAKQLDALNNNSVVMCFKPNITLFCKFNEWSDELLAAFGRIQSLCKHHGTKVVAVCSPEVTSAITPQLAYRIVEYFGQKNISVVFATKNLRKSRSLEDGVYTVY